MEALQLQLAGRLGVDDVFDLGEDAEADQDLTGTAALPSRDAMLTTEPTAP
jgi:hypothetical protein